MVRFSDEETIRRMVRIFFDELRKMNSEDNIPKLLGVRDYVELTASPDEYTTVDDLKSTRVWVDSSSYPLEASTNATIPIIISALEREAKKKRRVKLVRIWGEPEKDMKKSESKLNRYISRGWWIYYIIPLEHGALVILYKEE